MAQDTRPRSHPIPSIPHEGKVVDGRVLLVGDSAGMCDPLTGEGVRHAVLAGRAAADVLAKACSGEANGLADYQLWFESTMLPEMRAGMTLLGLAVKYETPGLLALQYQERARHACMSILRGKTSYTAVLRGADRVVGLLQILLGRVE